MIDHAELRPLTGRGTGAATPHRSPARLAPVHPSRLLAALGAAIRRALGRRVTEADFPELIGASDAELAGLARRRDQLPEEVRAKVLLTFSGSRR